MNGKCVAKSVNADLNTLQKELEELHREAKRVASQRTEQRAPEPSGMVVRGR
jgi:hypothetical protein